MLQGEDIIYVCEGDWSFERGGHMSSFFPRLLETNRILYVDLPTSSQVYYKNPRMLAARLRQWQKGVRQLRSNFYVYSPFPLVPWGDRNTWSNRINKGILAPFLRQAARGLSFKQPILIVQRFNSAELVGLWEEKISCYLCVDEYSFREDPHTRNPSMMAVERELLKKVDLVFTTSQLLYEDKKKWNPQTFLLPNAADSEHFGKSQEPETEIPEDIAAIPKPILGLVGTTPSRVDFELLRTLASKEPQWQIVLVGYWHSREVEDLVPLNNVHFIGWRDYSAIPSYLKAFDVCLIPFKVNQQTNTMNPYKLYEYVAAGKAVVATNLFEVRRFDDKYPGVIYVADSHQEFYEATKRALSEDRERMLTLRLQSARENTWKNRLEDMSRIIHEKLGEKKVAIRN